MTESLIKGGGEGLSSTTVFQLLDPAAIYGVAEFRYDFYLRGADVEADAIWQIWDGGGYVDMVRDVVGVPTAALGVTALGQTEWLKGVVVDAASTGLVQIDFPAAGTVDYWYALNSGAGKMPTTRGVQGVSSSTVEFFVEPGRVYTVVSDGTHSWNYATDADAASWTAFAEGATNGFSFDAPSTGRVQLVPTGAVNFVITSRKY